VSFQGAYFASTADFRSTFFRGLVGFHSVRFVGEALFLSAFFRLRVFFHDTIFTSNTDFSNSAFNRGAEFVRVAFKDQADFSGATFASHANFKSAVFEKRANFTEMVVAAAAVRHPPYREQRAAPEGVDLYEAMLIPDAQSPEIEGKYWDIADFTDARFDQPSLVIFRGVNRGGPDAGPPWTGLRARFINCDVEAVCFDGVRWHREDGHMILQDHLAIVANLGNLLTSIGESRQELVAVAYRRLVRNFERAGAYDLAEDCYCGSLEMQRRDPSEPLVNRRILQLYRLASYYGSSYERALAVLFFLILIVGVAYALPVAGLHTTGGSSVLGFWRLLAAGVFHAAEVSTFQRDALYASETAFGRMITIAATILLPAQLALFLLAVRRRFRR
jgi:uncharacterized protein YjbI with pentapeptide repeats